jgi:iron complex transport system substrate-binding protein
VAASGAADRLVGVSHECDHPPEVASLPRLTSTRLGDPGDSAGIHRDLVALVRETLSVYEVDAEALAGVRPDVVVTQDLCEVCAVPLSAVQAAVRDVVDGPCEVVSLAPRRLADIRADLLRVGAAAGAAEGAERAARAMDERLAGVAERARSATDRPTVVTLEWLDPPMIGGTWMPELVELAGGRALGAEAGALAPTLAPEDLARHAPDVVLVKPCGFGLERTAREERALRKLLEATGWPAVREGRVWVADGNSFFNRPGPRIADSAEILAACVHPHLFEDLAERHRGSFRHLDELSIDV